ncbi:MAG: hypothetical protein ACYTXE_43200, partial [Nostoc sp.]
YSKKSSIFSAKYGVLCVRKRWIPRLMPSKACLKLVGKYGDKLGDFREVPGTSRNYWVLLS